MIDNSDKSLEELVDKAVTERHEGIDRDATARKIAAVDIGSLVSEGEVNIEKVQNGVEYLAMASPFIGPTLGGYMNVCRRLFGVKTTAEGAYKGSKPDAS